MEITNSTGKVFILYNTKIHESSENEKPQSGIFFTVCSPNFPPFSWREREIVLKLRLCDSPKKSILLQLIF